jgi:hypothetical protein
MDPTTFIVEALSQKSTVKTLVRIVEAHICSCHLLDHQKWCLARPLDDDLLIVQIYPATHLTNGQQCIVVALVQLEEGGTVARFPNMAMEVR